MAICQCKHCRNIVESGWCSLCEGYIDWRDFLGYDICCGQDYEE